MSIAKGIYPAIDGAYFPNTPASFFGRVLRMPRAPPMRGTWTSAPAKCSTAAEPWLPSSAGSRWTVNWFFRRRRHSASIACLDHRLALYPESPMKVTSRWPCCWRWPRGRPAVLRHRAAARAQSCAARTTASNPTAAYQIDSVKGTVTDTRTGLMWIAALGG